MIRRPSFRQIEAFRAIMLTGSVSRAGDYLGLTQPAVSRLLRDLEERTGLSLFERTGNSIEPNPEAALLYREVDRHFIGLENIEVAVRHIRDAHLGSLRIACNTGAGLRLLPTVLADHLRQNPACEVTLQTLNSPAITEAVSLHRFEIGLANTPIGFPGIEVEPIAGLAGLCAIPADNALAAKAVIRIDDLREVPMLSLGQINPVWATFDALCQARGFQPNVVAQVSASESLCTLVALGCGIGIIDPFAAYGFTHSQVVLRPILPRLPYPHALIFPAGIARSRAVESFAARLRNVLHGLVEALPS